MNSVLLVSDYASEKIVARSTGNQRSSRLLSMRSANGMLVLVRIHLYVFSVIYVWFLIYVHFLMKNDGSLNI